MSLQFRPAQAIDVDSAVPLIYSSGPLAFDYVFAHHKKGNAERFLKYAFQDGAGEFGYRNHVVGIMDGKIVCAGAGFTGESGLTFTIAGARHILTFYGLISGWNVIRKGLLTERVVQPPSRNLYYIGHLGVHPDLRGQGIGTQLVNHLLLPEYTKGRSKVALDVAVTNPRAQALYERLGFVVTHEYSSTLQNQFGKIVNHRRMEKALD